MGRRQAWCPGGGTLASVWVPQECYFASSPAEPLGQLPRQSLLVDAMWPPQSEARQLPSHPEASPEPAAREPRDPD